MKLWALNVYDYEHQILIEHFDEEPITRGHLAPYKIEEGEAIPAQFQDAVYCLKLWKGVADVHG